MVSYQKVIWLVDDDLEDQFLVQRAFNSVKPSIAIQMLDDGDEVIPALTSGQSLPELIILDLNMARMDGFETLTVLRSMPVYQHIPVVVLTTSSNPRDQEMSEQLGATAFYTKPFNYQGLLDFVGHVTNRWLA